MVLERKKKTIKKRYQKWFVSNCHKRNSRINLPTHPNVHWTFFLAIEYGCGPSPLHIIFDLKLVHILDNNNKKFFLKFF